MHFVAAAPVPTTREASDGSSRSAGLFAQPACVHANCTWLQHFALDTKRRGGRRRTLNATEAGRMLNVHSEPVQSSGLRSEAVVVVVGLLIAGAAANESHAHAPSGFEVLHNHTALPLAV